MDGARLPRGPLRFKVRSGAPRKLLETLDELGTRTRSEELEDLFECLRIVDLKSAQEAGEHGLESFEAMLAFKRFVSPQHLREAKLRM